jgi:cell division protein FtsQ
MLVSVLALAALAPAAVAVGYSPLFAVADVRVIGAASGRTDEVRRAARILPGDNLLLADVRGAAAQVEALPWVRSASVRRLPPSTVELTVTRRDPAALVSAADGVWIVDLEGVVLAGGRHDTLPVIDAPGAVLERVGQPFADPAVANALSVLGSLPGPLRSLVDRYDAPTERGLRIRVAWGEPDAVWVRFGLAERVDAKARAIGLLLEQADPLRAAPETVSENDGHGQDVEGSEAAPLAYELDVRAPDAPVLVPVAPS